MSAKLIRAILVSLLQCAGQPMPEDALIEASRLACRPQQLTDADVRDKMRDLEALQFISGALDELTQERTWTLTDKGVHKARQLR